MNNMKQLLILMTIVCLPLIGYGQNFTLGKVSIDELKQQQHPNDSSAAAAVLFTKGDVSIHYVEGKGFIMTTNVRTRIKIYTQEGLGWADFSKQYYIGDNQSRESVSFSDAVTYNLENGEIVKTKLKKDGVFDTKVNDYWGQKQISMPNVKKGSVIEYEYTVVSPNLTSIDEWYFQNRIPVNYSEYTTAIPEYLIYKPNTKGYIYPKLSQSSKNRSINFSTKERSGGNVTTTQYSHEQVSYIENVNQYLASDLPAMKDETFVNNILNYTSSVSHELSMTRFPNTLVKNYSNTWEDVVKTIYDNPSFGVELNKTGYFEDDINKLIAPLKTDKEKMDSIYKYVKTGVKWNKYTGYFCIDGVRKAYKDKLGNVAEMNLMLTAMLRHAGVKADPVILSTRANGIAFFPNRTAFNYVITAAEVDGKMVLLDATEPYSEPNVLPLRDINWFGRLIKKDGSSSEIDLLPTNYGREAVFINAQWNGEAVEGKIRKQKSGHLALSFRQNYVGMNQDSYLEELERQEKNIEIDAYKRVNEHDLTKPVTETYAFRDTKSGEVIDDKIYLSPLLFTAMSQNPFTQEKREYPVDFGYPLETKCNLSIAVPKGYSVEQLPAPLTMAMDEKGTATFTFQVVSNGINVQIAVNTVINATIIPVSDYGSLKVFFEQIMNKEKEKIVFKKDAQ